MRSPRSRDKYLVFALALAMWGCPADGPLVSAPDMNDGADTGPGPDASAEAVMLAEVAPTEGPIAGGTLVTLTGAGFADGMTVRFGSGAAVDATVESPTRATATTPPSPVAGAVTVVVRNPDGESDSRAAAFTYVGEVQPVGAIGYCRLQAQSPASATTGVASDALYAIVFAENITTGGGQGTGIDAELGWGSTDDYESFNFVGASYNIDVDGLTPGDAANDEYGAPLTITTAGTYRYVARFKLASESSWTYCDLDGSDNGITADQLGVLEVADPPVPTVGYCRTQTQLVRTEVNTPSPDVTAQVFVAGATPGAGAGAGISGELLYGGAGTDPNSWSAISAAYLADADGLVAGDLANDVWSAAVPALATAGDYGFAFRFSADGGTTWLLCDTDGTTGPADFDAQALGTLEVLEELIELPDACRLQFPHIVEAATVGDAVEFFGRVSKAGLTGSGTAHVNLQGQLLIGPAGGDPVANPTAFTTIAAALNPAPINPAAGEDEYVAQWTPTAAGDYTFAFRFSVDSGANWLTCGLQDAASPSGLFTTSRMGTLVAATSPDTIDFCHVWQDALTDDAAAATQPTLTVEVFEDPVTVGNDGANAGQLEVEAAAIALELNPALAAATWNPLPYKGLRVGFANNYEYEGAVYTAGNHPTAGNYRVVARVRKAGSATWTYCDTDETAGAFRLDAATPLTVSP